MRAKMKVPEIRFRGFRGEWEEKRLDEIVNVIDGDRGHNYPHGNELKKIEHTLFLNAANVTVNGFKFVNNQYITEEKSESMGNGKLLTDDIVLTSRGSIGHVAWYNQEIMKQMPYMRINSGMLILRTLDLISPSLLAQLLNSPLGKKKIDLISFGSAQPQLTKKDISNYELIFPLNKLEQTKIGDYFQNLDKLIEQKEKKHQKLKQLKIAMLEKMFPKDGNTTPEIRFNGFSGEWGEKELGELAKITTGSSNRQDSGVNGEYTFFDRSDDIRTSDIYLFDCEAVIIAGEGSDFIPKYFVGKFDLHQRTYAVMSYKNGDSKFLFHFIYLFRKYFFNQAVGSTVKSLRLPMFQEMPIKFPTKDEQTKIGNYFQKLDSLIDLQLQELDKLKNIKKASLSKMFV